MAGAFAAVAEAKFVEQKAFREAMSRLGAAVHVITTDGPSGKTGFTATAVCSVALLWPDVRRSIRRMSPTNGIWFVWSAIFVAISQGLVYASLGIAPLMVVTPV